MSRFAMASSILFVRNQQLLQSVVDLISWQTLALQSSHYSFRNSMRILGSQCVPSSVKRFYNAAAQSRSVSPRHLNFSFVEGGPQPWPIIIA
jgi:hypothetical protein